jgi:predicted nucleic acid-binding protein
VRRVTLDTNEFVSALSGGSKALHLLQAAINGEIEIAISEPIISETVRVLREKFDWPPYDLFTARQRLERIAIRSNPKKLLLLPKTSQTTASWNAPRSPNRNLLSAKTTTSFG